MFLLVPPYPGSPGQKAVNGCVCFKKKEILVVFRHNFGNIFFSIILFSFF